MSGWIGAWGNAATVTNLTVTGSQVISVNTSTDALRITQTGAGNALVVEDSANTDATPFVINNAGNVGIGAIAATTSQKLFVTGGSLTDSSFQTIDNQTYIPSTGTGNILNYRSVIGTNAASFVVGTAVHFATFQAALGLGSSITNQIGFEAQSSLTGAANNFGFYGNIASGSGRYNFYAAGTADNYFAGNTYTASGTTSMTNGFFYIPSAAGAPSGVPTALSGRVPMYYDTTNNNFYIYNGSWKKVLLG